ncbi:MAG: hypothetical protein ABSG53_15985, partial [Thermoguttaceae bacterium]
MEPTRPRPRPARPAKSPDERKAPVSNNLSLLIIVVVVCVGLAAFLFTNNSPVVIKFGQFEQLIEKGAPSEKNKDPYVDVTESHNGRDLTVRYSNLSDLQVGPNEITGKVTREVLAPDDLRVSAKKETFSCSRYGLDQDNGHLQSRLSAMGFHDFQGGSKPSPWTSYVMLLILIAGVFIIAMVLLRRLGGASSAMAFGRSRGKLLAQEDIGVTF